jgi:hypothetical protein
MGCFDDKLDVGQAFQPDHSPMENPELRSGSGWEG